LSLASERVCSQLVSGHKQQFQPMHKALDNDAE